MAVHPHRRMILLYRLQDSRLGRAWMAIREDELAAASNGINTVTTKLLAFALGASTAGLAGVFNASKLTLVSPDQFLFTVSFTVLAMVVLGGMGNIWGVALGAFIIYMIQIVFLKQLNIVLRRHPGPDPQGHQLPAVPVPAVRHRAGADDAVPTRGPVPEPTPAAELHATEDRSPSMAPDRARRRSAPSRARPMTAERRDAAAELAPAAPTTSPSGSAAWSP